MLQPDQFGKFYGGGMSSLFPEGSAGKTTPPFPAAGRSKRQMPYDEDLVHKALRGTPETEQIDPREVHSTQSWVTREGVAHYMNPENQSSGKLFANEHEPGNRFPVVYSRSECEGCPETHMLLSGHHRATAALLEGRQFTGIRVKGGWGRAQ
jgi:hypothetical protein